MAATSPRKREAVAVEPRPFDVALNRVLILCAFAISMGHLEAVVVVYLRKLLGFIPATEDFTRVAVDGIPGWILSVEQTREAATIVRLVCLALLRASGAVCSLDVMELNPARDVRHQTAQRVVQALQSLWGEPTRAQ